ncbi:Flagellar biosynthesis protein FlhB [Caenispirillum salinarum AK4]|uniref:Flagellar biosynthetic protein FlhB n=1 Tax=Caenispirillum salinarum AK4 TaxID=1238182 RepID=K9GNM5_9PROT|nr:flagellar biosynthesis protein FlhB [Caenispirillum salinarum]EKV26677.1 Flagellar biosynthesis protein FlhB [Caenispirillum salinarum AK4]
MADEDKDSKTEEPTERRLEKAAEEGQIAVSQEVRNFFMLAGALIIVWLLGPWVMGGLRDTMKGYMEHFAVIDLSPTGVRNLFGQLMMDVGFYLAAPLALLLVLSVIGTTFQTGLRFTPKKLEPKISELSVVKGFKRIFSANSLVEFLKSLFKIVVVMFVATIAVIPFMRSPPQMSDAPLMVTLDHAHDMIVLLLAAVVIAVLLLAAADFAWQVHQHKNQLKMSKQELKDEFKDQEGDPQVKSKIRQLRAQRSKQRMMAAVPDASVVVTNPTHFAVALKYEMETMGAPTVVAKGQDLIALKIREIADENDVPIVENPPLARALYKAVEIDDEIPQEHYKAVAEVIGYVMKLKQKDPPKRAPLPPRAPDGLR